jgi:hypothetical protein
MLESVDSITDMIIVRNILLPKPQNETEKSYYSRIEAIAGKKGVCVSEFDSEIYFEDAKIYAMEREDMGYKNAVAFRISANNSVCTYAPSSARAVPNYFIEDSIEISDVVIFGSYGYKYEKAYTYETKTLDYVVFLGRSQYYCDMPIYNWQIKEAGHRFIFKSVK